MNVFLWDTVPRVSVWWPAGSVDVRSLDLRGRKPGWNKAFTLWQPGSKEEEVCAG